MHMLILLIFFNKVLASIDPTFEQNVMSARFTKFVILSPQDLLNTSLDFNGAIAKAKSRHNYGRILVSIVIHYFSFLFLIFSVRPCQR